MKKNKDVANIGPPLWDGHAAERIADVLTKILFKEENDEGFTFSYFWVC